MEPVAGLTLALDHVRDVVSKVPADAWQRPTNCAPWTASMMLSHLLGSQKLWIQTLTGEQLVGIGDVMSPQPLTGDALDETDAVIALATSTWSRPDVLTTEHATPFGPLTGAEAIVYPIIDALAHSWDLAVCAGLDPELDGELVAVGEAAAAVGVNDTTRGFGLFGEAIDPPATASPTTKLMAKTGRARL